MWAHMWPMYKAGVTPRGLDEPRDRGAKSGELVCGVRVAGWQDAPILTQPGPPRSKTSPGSTPHLPRTTDERSGWPRYTTGSSGQRTQPWAGPGSVCREGDGTDYIV